MDFVGTGAEGAKLEENKVSSIPAGNWSFYTHALVSRQQRKSKTTVRGKDCQWGKNYKGA